MEQRCTNCRYLDLDVDAIPCKDCSHGRYNGKTTFWQPATEYISDPFERLGALLTTQTYLLLEIGRLREEINKLVDVVKEGEK